MKTRTFQYQLSGLPAMLAFGFLALVVMGLVAVVVMVGAAVAVGGLALSVGAGLYYLVKRKLGGGSVSPNWKVEHSAAPRSTSSAVQVIEAEIVRQR